MGKQYLTKERLEEFKVELEELKKTSVEARIFELENLLKSAVVIERTGGNDVAQVGSVITIKRGDKTSMYTIVGKYEARPEVGRISDESPLGKAFLKHKVGDTITVTTPAGLVTYEILKIE
jgi:transcription elongation factor GreA